MRPLKEPKQSNGYERNMELFIKVQEHALIVSTGCSKAQDRAQERPPANADLSTLPAGISTAGGTATTVAASNQILLKV